ncbi:MAG: riboflavin synthase [Casimicrobiaceae bacterium]
MFTGIVLGVGRITKASLRGGELRIAVEAATVDLTGVAIGDSVAINGCCLTVVALQGSKLEFDVSAETRRCTTGLDGPGEVNLELALRLSDRLGGHLLAGHVDGTGRVASFAAVADDAYGSWRLAIDAPAAIARFIAPKGSIAVDGVSLTVNAAEGVRFSVNLIPHTLAVTTLKRVQPGMLVNLEADLVARYVARLRDFPGVET